MRALQAFAPIALAGIAAIGLFGSSAALAQQPQQAAKTPFEGAGTVQGMEGPYLATMLEGNPWLIKIDPKATVHVTGAAQADFLRPGLLVRFSGEFNRRTSKATAPLSELEIISLRPGDQAGAFPEDLLEEPMKTPGKRTPPPLTTRLRIVGQITSVRGTTLQVGKYKADINPNMSIKVDVADPTLASPEDKVQAKGWFVRPRALVAETLTIELTNPLSGKRPAATKGAKGAEKRAPAGAESEAPKELPKKERPLKKQPKGKVTE